MSNINQLVMDNLFVEGAVKTAGATLAGINGGLPGAAVGGYQAMKRNELEGNKNSELKQVGRLAGRTIASGIPIVGGISTYSQQKKLDALRKNQNQNQN